MVGSRWYYSTTWARWYYTVQNLANYLGKHSGIVNAYNHVVLPVGQVTVEPVPLYQNKHKKLYIS